MVEFGDLTVKQILDICKSNQCETCPLHSEYPMYYDHYLGNYIHCLRKCTTNFYRFEIFIDTEVEVEVLYSAKPIREIKSFGDLTLKEIDKLCLNYGCNECALRAYEGIPMNEPPGWITECLRVAIASESDISKFLTKEIDMNG